MIRKTVDYWVVGFNTPTESDLADAIYAAQQEKAVGILHWHTPAYPYYGSQSDVKMEVVADDKVEDLVKLLPTSYAV